MSAAFRPFGQRKRTPIGHRRVGARLCQRPHQRRPARPAARTGARRRRAGAGSDGGRPHGLMRRGSAARTRPANLFGKSFKLSLFVVLTPVRNALTPRRVPTGGACRPMWNGKAAMKNQVQLITYVDRLSGGGFADLRRLLDGPLEGLFGTVHALPFFYALSTGPMPGSTPSITPKSIPRLGTWDEVGALSGTRRRHGRPHRQPHLGAIGFVPRLSRHAAMPRPLPTCS